MWLLMFLVSNAKVKPPWTRCLEQTREIKWCLKCKLKAVWTCIKIEMNNLVTLATLGTQDTGHRQTNKNPHIKANSDIYWSDYHNAKCMLWCFLFIYSFIYFIYLFIIYHRLCKQVYNEMINNNDTFWDYDTLNLGIIRDVTPDVSCFEWQNNFDTGPNCF
jgi:hypothetical protein